MTTNRRKLAAGLTALALLAAGPIAAADARGGGGGGGGGGQVQPRPVTQPPQLPPALPQLPPGFPQLPLPPTNQHPVPELQPGDVAQVKVLRLLHSCRGSLPLARGGLEYEVFSISGATSLSVEIDNGPRNTPVTFAVDGTTLGTLTTDAFGDAKWVDTSGSLVPTVTSLVQISDARGVVVGTSC